MNYQFGIEQISQHIVKYGVHLQPGISLKDEKTKLQDYANWLIEQFPDVFETLMLAPNQLRVQKNFALSAGKRVDMPTFILAGRGPVFTFPRRLYIDGPQNVDITDHDRIFRKALDELSAFEVKLRGMPELPIHCDFHQGNLKFSDEKCIGVFDFDWAKIDYRLFDVALALVYFTSIWEKRASGMKADSLSLFLRSYNEACQRLSIISPLTRQEQRYIVPVIAIANLYVLHWEAMDFLKSPQSHDEEPYSFTNHTIGLLNWIAENQAKLEQWVKKSLN